VLAHIVQAGPITATQLADYLDLTAAGIRRHLAALESDGLITGHTEVHCGGRGRPARTFVVTDSGQKFLSSGYAAIATRALAYLGRFGPYAVQDFAVENFQDLEQAVTEEISEDDTLEERLAVLVDALNEAGYAASVRPIVGTRRLQLCQGHCPVLAVATRFPVLCEAETAAISRILGRPVQRLATLAEGAHVCTTNIPTGAKGIR